MAELVGKFNSGGTTSSTIDRQFTDEFVTKAVVEVPKRKRHFSVRADRFSMPKNSGDKLSREVSYGMLDKRVLVDGGVDANTATILQDVWMLFQLVQRISLLQHKFLTQKITLQLVHMPHGQS